MADRPPDCEHSPTDRDEEGICGACALAELGPLVSLLAWVYGRLHQLADMTERGYKVTAEDLQALAVAIEDKLTAPTEHAEESTSTKPHLRLVP